MDTDTRMLEGMLVKVGLWLVDQHVVLDLGEGHSAGMYVDVVVDVDGGCGRKNGAGR